MHAMALDFKLTKTPQHKSCVHRFPRPSSTMLPIGKSVDIQRIGIFQISIAVSICFYTTLTSEYLRFRGE